MSNTKLITNPRGEFEVIVISDGTTTSAEVVQNTVSDFGTPIERQLGFGTARRRRGDRRDLAIGTTLAISRAFRNAADKLDGLIEEGGL